MPQDKFADYSISLVSPATHLLSVTPNDGADLAQTCRALNVATSGTVRLTTQDGQTGTVYVAAGVAFPIRATRIWSTGTTATGIAALS